jgi:RNA-directed DNA polymerase
MEYRLMRLAQYVRGWMGYFGISDYYRPIPELDH